MIDSVQKLDFLPDGYFYGMVNTYNTSICGLLLYHPHFKQVLDALETQKQGQLVGLASRIYPALQIRPHEILDLMRGGKIILGQVTDNLSHMLLNIAYESVKHLLDKNNPVHEFFKHIRNGASHGGRWHFLGKEPFRLAEWRGRKITKSMEGNRILDSNIAPGDLVILLWDIEQTLLKKP